MIDETTETVTVIGVAEGREFLDLGIGGPGNIGTFHEILYEAPSPDSWELGDKAGRAHGVFVITPNDQAVTTLTLHFGDDESEDSITGQGTLPRAGDDIGRGILGISGGTGRFKNRSGQIRVDTKNPHKYSLER